MSRGNSDSIARLIARELRAGNRFKDEQRFRLIQDGIPVAWSEGPTALNEIKHYAAVYGQDGPVRIEQRINGRWKALPQTDGEA